jgi:hypothetical protein
MEITIEITDRNYEQIKEFCEFNKITIEDYIVQCAEDDFFTRKYGDLNEKLNKDTYGEKYTELSEKKISELSEDKKEIENKVEKKKVGRPKKVKEEAVSPIEKNEEFILRVEDTVNTNDNVGQTKIRKRTLKTR